MVVVVVVVVCLCGVLFCSVFQVPNMFDPANAKYGLASAVAFGMLLVGWWWMAFVGWWI